MHLEKRTTADEKKAEEVRKRSADLKERKKVNIEQRKGKLSERERNDECILTGGKHI